MRPRTWTSLLIDRMSALASADLTAWVLMGVSGSGKSTVGPSLAKALGLAFKDADDFHSAENKSKMARGEGLTDDDRLPWLASIASYLRKRFLEGKGSVITCSSLKRVYRDGLRRGCTHEGDTVMGPESKSCSRLVFCHLVVEEEVLRVRLKEREGVHFFPVSLLKSQLSALEPLKDDELGDNGLVCDGTLPVDEIVENILAHG